MHAAMKRIIAIASACALCLALGACSGGGDSSAPEDEPAYEKRSTVEYAVADAVGEYKQGDLSGASYRVAVPADTGDDELKAVFSDVVAGDGYGVHTLWFYSDARLTDGSEAFDVASAVQEAPDSDPVLIPAGEDAKAKAQAALASKGDE